MGDISLRDSQLRQKASSVLDEDLDDEDFDLEVPISARVPVVAHTGLTAPVQIVAPRARTMPHEVDHRAEQQAAYLANLRGVPAPIEAPTTDSWKVSDGIRARDERIRAQQEAWEVINDRVGDADEVPDFERVQARRDAWEHHADREPSMERFSSGSHEPELDPSPSMQVMMQDHLHRLGRHTSNFTAQTARVTSRTTRKSMNVLRRVCATLNTNEHAAIAGRWLHIAFYLQIGLLFGLLLDANAVRLSGSGAITASLATLCGIYASYFLLTQVVLLSNAPWLVRAFGRGRLTAWHHHTGAISVGLIAAHGIFTLTSQSMMQHKNVLTVADSIMGQALVPFAIAGFIMLVTAQLAKAKLSQIDKPHRYQYALSMWTAIGAGLAFGHQVNSGDLQGHLLGQSVLWTSYTAALGLFGYFRIGLPIRTLTRHQLRVEHVVEKRNGTTSIYLNGSRLEALRKYRHQELEWRFLTRSNWRKVVTGVLVPTKEPHIVRVILTIDTEHELATNEIQLGTMATYRLPIEDPFEQEQQIQPTVDLNFELDDQDIVDEDSAETDESEMGAPLFPHVPRQAARAHATKLAPPVAIDELPAERRIQRQNGKASGALFIGAGKGVYRIIKLLEGMPEGMHNVSVIFRVVDPADALAIPALEAITMKRHVQLHLAVGKLHNFPPNQQPMTPPHLLSLIPDIADREVFVCANSDLLEQVSRSLHTLGHLPKRLHCAPAA